MSSREKIMRLIDGLARMSDTDIDNLFKVTSMMNEIENDGRRDEELFNDLLSLSFSEQLFKSKISELEFELVNLKQRLSHQDSLLHELKQRLRCQYSTCSLATFSG